MVCRESSLSSTIVTFARDMSGLQDNQVLALNHALLQEHAAAGSVVLTDSAWQEALDQVRNDYTAGRLSVVAGSHNPLPRLERARTEAPNAARLYAARNLVARAIAARDAQNEFFDSYARDLGVTRAQASTEFWAAFQDASANARACASPAFVRAWQSNPDHTNMPVDRRSLYAFEQMEIARAARDAAGQVRPAVTRESIDHSMIREIGYDEINGRLELVFASNPDRVYAYRMPAEDYQAFRAADRLGSYFGTHIRNNRDYQYDSVEDAAAAGVHRRCATCGQWAGTSHTCPVHGSDEEINRDVRHAVEAARTRAAGLPAGSATITPVRLPRSRTMRYTADYDGAQLALRMPGVSRVTAEARRATAVQVPVLATFHTPGNEGSVSGLVTVTYNGRGQGYTIAPVTEPGDSGRDQLRCTCARYRATYHCEHVDAAVARIAALTNGTETATPEQIAVALPAVSAPLAAQHAASVAANQATTDAWVAPPVSLEADPAAFQEVYEEFRAARTAYRDAIAGGADPATLDYPVPYQRDNAFGGLATRDTGRGFGVELEFSFPGDWDSDQRSAAIRAIGTELYAAGLTTTRQQLGYGASHGQVRTEHARGWSFENDATTGNDPRWGGGEVVMGGEIVSPVMYDEPDTWTNLEKVCDVLRRHGAIASVNAGMHVHVSTGDYDHQVENHNRLLQAYGENEDLIYRLSANPERGRHRGRAYCNPNSLPSNAYTSVGDAARHQTGHHIALNLQSVSGRRGDHVEFRTFDSSLTPAVIQSQIGTSVYLTSGATRADAASTVPNEGRNRLGDRVRANPDRAALTGESWNASTLGMRRLIDKFVPSHGEDPRTNPRARQLIALFAMTRWQRTRS